MIETQYKVYADQIINSLGEASRKSQLIRQFISVLDSREKSEKIIKSFIIKK